MMNYTVIEKIIAKHTTQQVAPGEIVIADVDCAMASDTTGPMAINAFNEMGVLIHGIQKNGIYH